MQKELVTESNSIEPTFDIVKAVWQGKWIVVSITALFAILSVVVALSLTNVYRSEALLAPVGNDNNAASGLSGLVNQFGGLASMTGLSLGGVTTDKTTLAIEFLQSRTFLTAFIERHELLVPLMASKGWDQMSNKLILDEEIYVQGTSTWVRNVSPPRKPEPSLLEAYEFFMEIFTIERDKSTGFITLSIEHYSPEVAHRWVNLLVDDLNDFMRTRDMKEAQDSIAFLQTKVAETNVVGMQESIYTLIEEQLKITMLAQVRSEYALSYVDPPVIPEMKFKPRRAVICIVGTFAGGVIGIIIALLWSMSRRPKP